MSDEDALLAAIIADPDDDTPRLVYADWLQENGDEDRAEFIRVQIERARIEPGSDRHLELRRREAVLQIKHRDRWLRQLPRRIQGARYHFRRGFAEVVELDAHRLVNHERDYRFGELIGEVIASNAQACLSTLSRSPRPPGIRLRARVDHGESGPPILLDLLRSSPLRMESFLLRGRWLILCWAVWSGPDRTAVHLLGTFHRTRKLPGDVAVRAFDEHAEFSTWCTVQERFRSPIWLVFKDGELIDEVVGLEPVMHLSASVGIS
jgi:uncharacterized protein (TIGR02996 family)